MPTCGYVCPQCNGVGFLSDFKNCNWCNPEKRPEIIQIYYNHVCSKSIECLEIIKENFSNIQIINYLEETPELDKLKEIVKKLNITPFDLIRKKEEIYKNNFAGQNHSDEEWIRIICQNPILMERPILVCGNRAIIAREKKVVTDFINQLR
jgi:arsenate reductase